MLVSVFHTPLLISQNKNSDTKILVASKKNFKNEKRNVKLKPRFVIEKLKSRNRIERRKRLAKKYLSFCFVFVKIQGFNAMMQVLLTCHSKFIVETEEQKNVLYHVFISSKLFNNRISLHLIYS